MQEQKRTFMQRVGDILLNRNVTHYVRPETPETPAPTGPTPDQIAWAIKQNETRGVKGDPYRFSRFSGNKNLGQAIGAYQTTEGDLKTYAPRFIGQTITGKEFQASTTAQENYMKNKIKFYREKGYTPEQIADIHRAGYTKSGPPGSEEYQNPRYVEAFKKFLEATTTPVSR